MAVAPLAETVAVAGRTVAVVGRTVANRQRGKLPAAAPAHAEAPTGARAHPAALVPLRADDMTR